MSSIWKEEKRGVPRYEKEGVEKENMTELKLLTYNVKGLNTPGKRHKISKVIKQYAASSVYLQETHKAQDARIRLYSKEHPIWYYGDSPTKRAKGVVIKFAKETRLSLKKGKWT